MCPLLSILFSPLVRLSWYKLLPEKVLVKVSTIIQELNLDFQNEGRTRGAQGLRLRVSLSDE